MAKNLGHIKVAIIGLLVGYFLWQSEPIQKTFFPSDYWEGRARYVSGNIAETRADIVEIKDNLRTLTHRESDIELIVMERDMLRKDLLTWEEILKFEQEELAKIQKHLTQ